MEFIGQVVHRAIVVWSLSGKLCTVQSSCGVYRASCAPCNRRVEFIGQVVHRAIVVWSLSGKLCTVQSSCGVYRASCAPCNRRVEFIGQVVYPRVLRLKLGVCGTRFET